MPRPDRLAERSVIRLVESGELVIDRQGRVWRVAARRGLKRGGSHLVPCSKRRAEHRTPKGYLQVRALINGERVHALAHRLVWHHFYGPIPGGLTINHRDGIKDDNQPANLELATNSQQVRHADRLGLRSNERDANGRFKAGRVGKKPARS